jgi:hypothetical protein
MVQKKRMEVLCLKHSHWQHIDKSTSYENIKKKNGSTMLKA